MLKFIRMREDNQRWQQMQNPMLSPRRYTNGPRGIGAVWETAYGRKSLTNALHRILSFTFRSKSTHQHKLEITQHTTRTGNKLKFKTF